jgi:hypothetical protein
VDGRFPIGLDDHAASSPTLDDPRHSLMLPLESVAVLSEGRVQIRQRLPLDADEMFQPADRIVACNEVAPLGGHDKGTMLLAGVGP